MGRGIALPALAAGMVVVVVALSLTLPGVLRHHGTPPGPAAPDSRPAGVPRYYVTAAGPMVAPETHLPPIPQQKLLPVSAEVVDSRTGRPVTVVKPPPGFRSFVQFGGGSADDRAFVLEADRTLSLEAVVTPVTFFLLPFDPGTMKATLRRLPELTVDHAAAGWIGNISVSPDASRLAVSVIGPGSATTGDEAFPVSVLPRSACSPCPPGSLAHLDVRRP